LDQVGACPVLKKLFGRYENEVILQHADRCIEELYGMLEDVLVKIGDFLFAMDFLVLDIRVKGKQPPILFGRPF
jgi:hypothetical protein